MVAKSKTQFIISPTIAVSMRFPTIKLQELVILCETYGDKRSKFIARAAYRQAKRVLANKLPFYEPVKEGPLRDPSMVMSTIVVAMRQSYLDLVEQACKRLHHKLSLFIVWSALAELHRYQEVGPDQLSFGL